MMVRARPRCRDGDAELPGLQKKIIRESLARISLVSPHADAAVDASTRRSHACGGPRRRQRGNRRTDAVMLSQETAAGTSRQGGGGNGTHLSRERHFRRTHDYEKAPRELERADNAIAWRRCPVEHTARRARSSP